MPINRKTWRPHNDLNPLSIQQTNPSKSFLRPCQCLRLVSLPATTQHAHIPVLPKQSTKKSRGYGEREIHNTTIPTKAINPTAKTLITVAKFTTITPTLDPQACNKVTVQTHAIAASLFAHTGVVAWASNSKNITLLTYCAKTVEIVATPHGLTATLKVQRNRNPRRGEYVLVR